MARSFSDLTEEEILALAISQEEEDARIYGEFAKRLEVTYPDTAKVLLSMQLEEFQHAAMLKDMHRRQFGDHIPYVRRHDIKGGTIKRKPLWLSKILTVPAVRREIEAMEMEALHYYRAAIKKATNPAIRKLLERLATEEQHHEDLATKMVGDLEKSGALKKETEAERRTFVLQVVQPGLAGLMDGSVSTLAPVFAAAFATENSRDAFLVGLAASIGAGISMGFAEALSDDGVLSGRGRPYIRGTVCGLMTALGGVGHTLPFLIGNFHYAMIVAVLVVAVELAVISWIRHKYMDTPLMAAAFQVVVGGVLVFITGILIGSA
jgi:erythrin-vacuolar iron transport family protein